MTARWQKMVLIGASVASLACGNQATARDASAPRGVATAASSYLPGTVVIHAGDQLQFLNLDAGRHSVTSKSFGDQGHALFDSGIVGLIGTAEVAGVPDLEPNRDGYEFFCQIHPWMEGTLVVLSIP